MVMTADDILLHPALERCVRVQAQSLLSVHEASPRMASLFATQQRWLLAHAAVAQYFRNEADEAGSGLLPSSSSKSWSATAWRAAIRRRRFSRNC